MTQGHHALESMAKIKPLAELAASLSSARESRKRIVHCHGVFDLLHVGHLRYFQEAKAMGDVLVVTLTTDRFVNKGPHRPAFPEQLRAEVLAGLAWTSSPSTRTPPPSRRSG